MRRWLSKAGAKLLDMAPTRRAAENGGEVHRILLGGPLLCDRVIIAEPAILPHQARLDGEFVSNAPPPRCLSSKIHVSNSIFLFTQFLSKLAAKSFLRE